jgi:hypothetical protein
MTWVPSVVVRKRYRGINKDRIHNNTLAGWVKRGIFPKPITIGNRNYWRSEDLDAYDAELTRKNKAEPVS